MNIIDDIGDDVFQAFEKVGAEIVDAQKEALSVPVEVSRGPRGGRIVIRSKPGEHPRRETGRLQAAVTQEVQRDGAIVTLIITDPVPYAQFLENKDRIVTSDIPGLFTETVTTAAVDAINKS